MKTYYCAKCDAVINLYGDYDLICGEAVCPVACDNSLRTQMLRLIQKIQKWWAK